MFACSVVAILLTLSSVVQATGDSKYTQYAFKFKSSANCLGCAKHDTECFSDILSCVKMSFHTHNVSFLKHFCNPDNLWMLLVLELQPSAAIDGSQYLAGCVNSMSTWTFWYYAECSMDIFGANDYRNCTVKSHLAIANPVSHLPAWVYVVIALVILAFIFILTMSGIIPCVCICKKWNKFCFRNPERLNSRNSDNEEKDPLCRSVGVASPVNANPRDYGPVGPRYAHPTPRSC